MPELFFAKLKPLSEILCSDEHKRLALIDYDDERQLAEQQAAFMNFVLENSGRWARFTTEDNGYTYAIDVDDVVLVSEEWLTRVEESEEAIDGDFLYGKVNHLPLSEEARNLLLWLIERFGDDLFDRRDLDDWQPASANKAFEELIANEAVLQVMLDCDAGGQFTRYFARPKTSKTVYSELFPQEYVRTIARYEQLHIDDDLMHSGMPAKEILVLATRRAYPLLTFRRFANKVGFVIDNDNELHAILDKHGVS